MKKVNILCIKRALWLPLLLLLLYLVLIGCSAAPVVTSVSPADNQTDVKVDAVVTVGFNKKMSVGTIHPGSFTLKRQTGETVNGTVAYDYAARTATFTPLTSLAFSTIYQAAVSTTITDEEGTPLEHNREWIFTTEQKNDTVPPSIVSTLPKNHNSDISVETIITIRFDETISEDSIHEKSFVLEDSTGLPVPGSVSYEDTTDTATFFPNTDLSFNTTYTVKVTTAVADVAGNNLIADMIWCFTTEKPPDTVPPAQPVLKSFNADNGRITITWHNPSDADLDHTSITWIPGGNAEQPVTSPLETYAADGLVNNKEYTFLISSVDSVGNTSVPLSFKAIPSASKPITVDALYSATDLDGIRLDLNGHYILLADIDLSESFGGGWQPIGTGDDPLISGTEEDDPFLGSLDGNGHIISGLYIYTESNFNGLFGCIGEGSVVKNLGVENCDVTGGKYYIGGLVGCNKKGTILNCHSTGMIESGPGGAFVGGLVGMNSQGPMSSCYSMATVTGGTNVGGLAGRNNNADVTDCYTTGNVIGTGPDIGGLFGYSNTCQITNCYAAGSVTGTSNVGGLCGSLNYVDLSNCYSVGAVIGSSAIGGLIGSISNTTINYSYYDTNTSGQNDTNRGEPRTTDQMKLIDTSTVIYENWDFSNIWVINGGYPYLLSNP